MFKEVSNVINQMIKYYEGDTKRINHFMKVYAYAKTIGELEGLDTITQYTLEIAAITHDIGIKLAEEKYNSSAGNFQEIEGPAIAKEMLSNLNINENVIDRVCYLIGHHHTYDIIDKIDYQILVEADFLVNIDEDNLKKSSVVSVENKIFKTESGKKILECLYKNLSDEEEVVEEVIESPEEEKDDVEKIVIDAVKEVKEEVECKPIEKIKDWQKESIFYHIYPLGFCGAPQFNNEGKVVNRIKKVIEWIPYLKSLGVNAIYFGPIFDSVEHGYDTNDYNLIDKRLGTNEDFKEVCNELHKNGIRIVLDGVFNHVGRDFWAFKDVQQNGQNSKYCGWFNNLNFGGQSPYGDPFSYEAWEGHFNLVKLNTRNREVIDYLLNAVGNWMDEYKIDGLRLDAADCIDDNFYRELHNYTKAKDECFWLMGEIIHGDYNRWANPDMLDSVTNYECYKGIYSSHNCKNYFEIAYSLNRQFGNGGIYKWIYTYNFVDNHDVNRIGSTVTDKRYLDNIYSVLYTMPGVPSIYYGSEYGIEGMKANGSDAPIRPCLEIKDIDTNNELINHIKKLGKIRLENEALKYGEYEQVLVRNEQLVYKRFTGNQSVYILLNLADHDEYVNFNIDSDNIKDILNDEDVQVNGRNVNIVIPAFSTRILA